MHANANPLLIWCNSRNGASAQLVNGVVKTELEKEEGSELFLLLIGSNGCFLNLRINCGVI